MKALDRIFHKNQGVQANKSAQTLTNREQENGSVIIIIFVMIAILAALIFTLNQGSRTGANNLSSQQADLAATEILNYARTIKNAVRNVQINGCADDEINFDNPILADYDNTNAPADDTCDIFNANGGDLRYIPPQETFLDTNLSGATTSYYGEWAFTGNHCINGIGTCPTDNQLILFLSQINSAICTQINQRNNIDSASIPTENWDITKPAANFVGTYTLATNRELDNSAFNGKSVGCFQDNTGTASGHYIFYQVLLAR